MFSGYSPPLCSPALPQRTTSLHDYMEGISKHCSLYSPATTTITTVYLHPFNQLQFFTTTFLSTVFTEPSLPLCSLASLQQNASFHHYMVKISNIVHWILSTTVFSNTSTANCIISSLYGEVGSDLQHCSLDSLHQCVQQHLFSKVHHFIPLWGGGMGSPTLLT